MSKPACFVFILLCAGMLPSNPCPAEENVMSGIIPYEHHEEVLENGLKVILMPMPGNGLVAYWTIVRTGSRDEYEPGRSGFAHFFEHMMFRGTENYPAERYNEVLTSIGADGNAFTTDDLTAYHLSIAAEDLLQAMEIESDRIVNLAYKESAFRTEAGAVYGEYRKSRTSPIFTIYESLIQVAFQQHPYGHTTLGYEADIKEMPEMYDYSLSFFSRHYRPDNTILFIAGDIEIEPVMALVEEHYGDWEPGYLPPSIPIEPEQRSERRLEVPYEGRTLPILWVAYKLDSFDPNDRTRVATDLLTELAFGSSSDVYQRLVLEEQVVEFLRAESNKNRDPSLLDIYARVKDPMKVDYVLSIIDETVSTHQESVPTAERLAAIKSRLKYNFLMALQTPDDTARRLARYIALSGGLEGVEKLYQTYEILAPDDVRTAARTYLNPDRRTVAVLRGRE